MRPPEGHATTRGLWEVIRVGAHLELPGVLFQNTTMTRQRYDSGQMRLARDTGVICYFVRCLGVFCI